MQKIGNHWNYLNPIPIFKDFISHSQWPNPVPVTRFHFPSLKIGQSQLPFYPFTTLNKYTKISTVCSWFHPRRQKLHEQYQSIYDKNVSMHVNDLHTHPETRKLHQVRYRLVALLSSSRYQDGFASLAPAWCQLLAPAWCFLSTSLMQIVSTTCSKSVNNKLQQIFTDLLQLDEFNRLAATCWQLAANR